MAVTAPAFEHEDLKGATALKKISFSKLHKVDFIDLVAEVAVEAGMSDEFS